MIYNQSMITYNDIKPYIDNKLISEQRHPENHDIAIFNYTQKTQFEKAWDDITIQCRGLIMNVVTGEIIARPFSKFFNLEEHLLQGKSLPEELPIISKKMDGSLGILYYLDGTPYIATRGSFVSEQAVWATQYFREKMGGLIFQFGVTYLFEIIAKFDKKVVNYDFEGLVFLACINNDTGRTEDIVPDGCRISKIIPPTDLISLQKLNTPNEEGFVAYYPNSELRVKVKFSEYCRLHKLLTNISPKSIWEIMRSGQDISVLLNNVPDEFFTWVKNTMEKINNEYMLIEKESRFVYDQIKLLPTRKEQALAVHTMMVHSDSQYANASIVFNMLDDKEYADLIYRLIKPTQDATYSDNES